jgi:hypothetical protein
MESFLQPAAPAPARLRLADLDRQVAARERELLALGEQLQQLQSTYLGAVGAHYARLVELDEAIAAAEIRAGLRPPPESVAGEHSEENPKEGAGCSNRGGASGDLKKIFRELARTIHPDLAVNDPARLRRHSLMAEANRAYAERDEDRLRLILHAWHGQAEAVDPHETEDQRAIRRVAWLEDRLRAIDAEFADLETSAICQLKRKIDAARAQGWDLLAEMIAEEQRDVRRASARLSSVTRAHRR